MAGSDSSETGRPSRFASPKIALIPPDPGRSVGDGEARFWRRAVAGRAGCDPLAGRRIDIVNALIGARGVWPPLSTSGAAAERRSSHPRPTARATGRTSGILLQALIRPRAGFSISGCTPMITPATRVVRDPTLISASLGEEIAMLHIDSGRYF